MGGGVVFTPAETLGFETGSHMVIKVDQKVLE